MYQTGYQRLIKGKMKKITILLSVILLATATESFAQIRKANRNFDLYKYSKAIPLYQKAARSKKDEVRKEATLRLADCYRFVNNAEEARSWYLRATEFSNIDPINYFYLGQAYRTLQEYALAQEAFQKYATLQPDDPRGEAYARYCGMMEEWQLFPPASEIRNVKNLNSRYSDFGPAFFENGLVYTSDRNPSLLENKRYGWTNFNYLNLYQADPKFFRDFWRDMAEPVSMSSKFNQTFHDGPAFFTPDSKSIYLTRTKVEKIRKEGNSVLTYMLKIYYSSLEDKIDYKAFPHNSDSYSTGHPTVSKDGKTMIFATDMPGGKGGSDLYLSSLTGGSWSTPVSMGEQINTFGNEVFPTLVNDTLLYFASDGLPGYGGLDLYVCRLADGRWSEPENLHTPINSSYDDFSIAVAADMKSGFFSSNRPGGEGNDDIYAFRNARPPVKTIPVKPAIQPVLLAMKGMVNDKTTGKPFEKAKVFVLNTKSNKVKVLETNADGVFTMPAEKNILYVAKAVKSGYIDDCLNFRIESSDTASLYEVPRPLMLDKLEVNKSFRVENIYYDLDKWFIREDAKPALDNLVEIMKKYPITAELSSHTDSRASHAYNEELSQKRAEAAVRYIVLQGVDPSRIIAKGYGENRLVNGCSDGVICTEEEHQANRRTEFKILSIQQQTADDGFNPDTFATEDEVDVYLFDPEFFRKCFGSKALPRENITNDLKVEKTVAQEVLLPAPAQTVSGACYGVQLAAVGNIMPVNDPWFKGIKDIKIYKSGRLNKYVAGCNDRETAQKLLSDIQAKGFKEAFLVKIENEQILLAR